MSLISGFYGFLVWFVLILLYAIFTFLITSNRTGTLRGRIPDRVFEYSYRPDFIPKNAFLLDTHSHTIASDGWMTPEQNIKWHIANGYQAFVITDHNTDKNNAPALALQSKYPEILIIPGYEWTNPKIHMNFIGLESFSESVPRNPSDEDIAAVISRVIEKGAVVQVDHISWTVDRAEQRDGRYVHPTRDQLYSWGVHGFEINNEMRWYDPRTLHWLENGRQSGKITRSVYIGTGTDVHNPLREQATGWTEVLLTPEEKKNPTIEIVLNALKEGRTKIWVDHDYRAPPEQALLGIKESTWKMKIFAPWFALVQGIGKVPGMIVSWVLWGLLSYFPLRWLFQWILTL